MKKLKKRKQRFWMKEWYKQRTDFFHVKLLQELEQSEKDYFNFLRMNAATYQELLSLVRPIIQKQDTLTRNAITPHERLSATLRFLASGGSFQSLKFLTSISPRSLGYIVMETYVAIIETLKQYIQVPKTENEWKCIADDFYSRWNFPNCIGAIDGKHVEIEKPPESGSYYYNYKKKTCSIVMMAIVNARYEFIAVEVGPYGRASDAGIFAQSAFKCKYDEKELHIPEPASIPMSEDTFPHVFIGDDAFPLMENLLKPYSRTQLNEDEIIFNYRLSRARNVVKNTFDILTSRFRILANKLTLSPDKASKIVLACCYLHNYLKTTSASASHNDSCRTSCQLSKLEPLKGGNALNIAKSVRNKYFNTVGAVPWQKTSV